MQFFKSPFPLRKILLHHRRLTSTSGGERGVSGLKRNIRGRGRGRKGGSNEGEFIFNIPLPPVRVVEYFYHARSIENRLTHLVFKISKANMYTLKNIFSTFSLKIFFRKMFPMPHDVVCDSEAEAAGGKKGREENRGW